MSTLSQGRHCRFLGGKDAIVAATSRVLSCKINYTGLAEAEGLKIWDRRGGKQV